MTQVPRSPRKPLVTRTACPAPGDVLFKRGVSAASVAAQGEATATEWVHERRVASVSSLSVASVCGQLRTSSGCVASVASELQYRVASASQCPVASQSQRSVEFASTHAASGPKGTLSRVLEGLRRTAIAAKVQRGRQRFVRTSGQGAQSRVPALQPVASELVRFASVASTRCQSPSVRFQSVVSVPVAFTSVSVACVSVSVASASQFVASQSVSVASELSQSVQRPGCARVLH